MAAALSAGENYDRFTDWAVDQGIKIHGIAPARFVGRGLGLVAAKDLKKGDCLVFVPQSAMLTINSEPIRTSLTLPKEVTVHARLAVFLASMYASGEPKYRAWFDVWPTQAEFKDIMPMNWDKSVQGLLPHAAKELLHSQQQKFKQDLSDVRDHLPPKVSESIFTYVWQIVNTRCFYWDYPNVPAAKLPKGKRSLLKSDDCEALIPFMDLFNHDTEGCDTHFDTKGYSVIAEKDYKAGDEIYVSYGPHSNDFLLVEYGFILPENKNDYTTLDHLILPRLSKEQEEILKEDKFHGKYILSPSSDPICHRTQSALRLLTIPYRRYTAFISGSDDGLVDQDAVNAYLRKLLERYQREIMEAEEGVEELVVKRSLRAGGGVSEVQKETLRRRCRQLGDMVKGVLEGLGG